MKLEVFKMDLIQDKQYKFNVRHEGTYKMKYIGTNVDKDGDTMLMFIDGYTLYPDAIEFNKSEIISINPL
jgi:hypothetical protein